MTRTVAFLSGAPRTSTKSIASLTGGRQHILGTIGGFKANGWNVLTYILGDRVPESWLKGEHEMNKGKSLLTRLGADVLRILLSAKHVRIALREIPKPDWTYERYAAYQMFGYFFQRRGTPWILETNDALFDQAKGELKHVALPFLVRWAEKFAYRQCDVLVVISDDLKQIIVDNLQISADKIVVLPNAADAETFDPDSVVACRLFDSAVTVIGWQGGMYKWAGLDYLLQTVAALRKHGSNVGAVLLGDGHERKHLESLATELGISDFIKFPGRVPREEVPAYIAGYDICYSGQINWNENSMYLSPLKLYDYMAMGKPVIASRFADAVKLTRNGTLGYLYEAGNLDDLIATASRAYEQRATLPRMGQGARAEILENHTWASRIHELIGTVQTFLDSHPTQS